MVILRQVLRMVDVELLSGYEPENRTSNKTVKYDSDWEIELY
jgi:hypothetical protein